MSYELVTEKGSRGQFASNSGLMALIRVAKTPALKKFFRDGHSKDVKAVFSELGNIDSPSDVKETALTLMGLMSNAKEILISDGLTGNDGIKKGGPGSGCHGPNCGRPEGSSREEQLKSEKITSKKELGGGISESYVVQLEDGKGVFKPKSDEDDIQPAREVAAWEVAKLVGMDDMVPSTVMRTIDGREGSLQDFKQGTIAEDADYAYDGNNIGRAGVYDYVIGNTDRHMGNWLVETQGFNGDQLHLIDHGLAFTGTGPYSGNSNILSKLARDETIIPRSEADKYVKSAKEIEATLGRLSIPKEARNLVQQRIQQVTKAKDFKELRDNYYDRRPARNPIGSTHKPSGTSAGR